MKNKIIDLFSGAGGLSLGFENAGYDTVLAIDFWQPAIETFNYNRKNKVGLVKDITTLDENFFKNYDLDNVCGIVGGPPCQGFSMAGRRIIDDERNKLCRDYFRVLKIINPYFFVMENVTGILNLNGGAVKDDIFKRANEAGYKVFIKTLCAAEHGVPQNRRRVFFVGIRKDKVKGDFNFPVDLNYRVNCEEAISDLPRLDLHEDNTKYRCKPISDYQRKMRKNSLKVYNHEQSKHTKETILAISYVPEGGGIKDIPESIRGDRNYSSLLRRMDRSKPSQTIDTGHRTYFHYEENRIISDREAARLQSFPDDYIFLGSKQHQYKQVGNAVPPILAFEVASSIKKYFEGDE